MRPQPLKEHVNIIQQSQQAMKIIQDLWGKERIKLYNS